MKTTDIEGIGRHSGKLCALVVAAALCAPAAHADSGFFLGGSVGRATLDIQDFDDSNSSWKAYGGYIIDLPVIDFSVEVDYVDFGTLSESGVSVDATALDAFAIVGFDFAVVGIFGKYGVASWDADIDLGGLRYSDDGTDSVYGLGVRFNVASVEIRVEYEDYDIEDTDGLDMISAGVAWRF